MEKTRLKKFKNVAVGIAVFTSAAFSPQGYAQYCTSGLYTSGCTYGDDVGVVQFNTINNITNNCPGGNSGYADYTNIQTVVCRGDSFPITVGTSSTSYAEGFGVWIDFNNDSDFVDNGEFVYASPTFASAPTTFTGMVYIPMDAAAGPTRLRVRGSYDATVSASESCSNIYYGEAEDYTVIIGGVDSLTLTSANLSCYGDTASLTVTAYGGTTPYTYQWDSTAGSQTTATATGLTVGTYIVQVSDSFGCPLSDTAIITGNPQIVTATSGDLICFDDSSGTVSVNATGGTPPFSYQWSNNTGNQTTTTATGLPGGTYVVTITDSMGCTTTDSAVIDLHPQLIVSAFGNNASSLTNCDGSAVVLPSSDQYPFSFIWDDTLSQTTQAATGLCPGTYHVTVTDGNGCTAVASAVVGPVVGVEEGALSQYVSVYPNPSSGKFVIDIHQKNSGKLNIGIINVLGQQVYTKSIMNPADEIRETIDLSNRGDGFYRIEISTDYGIIRKHIIIN